MQTLTDQDNEAREGAARLGFVSLDHELRAYVGTAIAAYHLGRQPQTLRAWASAETFPKGLKPIRVCGRLAWPVASIRKVLGVPA